MIPRPPFPVTLAQNAVKNFLAKGTLLPSPSKLPSEFEINAGTFVSIKKGQTLRGCIGTISPRESNLAMEIIRNAVHAATRDPRFPAIKENEFPELTFSVDVLTPKEKVKDLSELDCKKYGLIVQSGGNQGILLPDLEGIQTVEEQFKVCKQKGGIKDDDPIELYRFEVKRYR